MTRGAGRAEGSGKCVRVLGVDPGTRTAGYGILDAVPGRRPRVVECGAIRLEETGLPARLVSLYRDLRRIIAEHEPEVIAVETVFHGRSFDSVLKVGEARGVVLLVGALCGLEIREFTPALVKKASTGNGRASKQQVQRMIGRLLELRRAPETTDVTDALAIAFCYGQRMWRERLTGGGVDWKQLAKKAREARPGPGRPGPRSGRSGSGRGKKSGGGSGRRPLQ